MTTLLLHWHKRLYIIHKMFYIKKIYPLLQRITSSGERLIYVDGLRFFAVISVFIFHFIDFYDDNNANFVSRHILLTDYLQGSVMGVILFFSISGFLIAMPFYNSYVSKNHQFSLKNYYFRRLTRLEPPYMVQLLLLFILMVFVLKTKTFTETFPHLLASVFYCHEIVYGKMPILNTVLWTLEIEIQFYILAPLLAAVFMLNVYSRRLLLIAAIGIFTFYKPVHFDFPTVFKYIHFFLIGFLALDVYMQIKDKYRKHVFFDVLCFMSIVLLWFSTDHLAILFLYILLVYSSKTIFFFKVLENKVIYTIGGMCYTIYMLHQKLIYFVYAFLFPDVLIGNNYLPDFFIRLIITLLIILSVSAVFFILVERPTMKKEWWKYKSFKKLLFT